MVFQQVIFIIDSEKQERQIKISFLFHLKNNFTLKGGIIILSILSNRFKKI